MWSKRLCRMWVSVLTMDVCTLKKGVVWMNIRSSTRYVPRHSSSSLGIGLKMSSNSLYPASVLWSCKGKVRHIWSMQKSMLRMVSKSWQTLVPPSGSVADATYGIERDYSLITKHPYNVRNLPSRNFHCLFLYLMLWCFCACSCHNVAQCRAYFDGGRSTSSASWNSKRRRDQWFKSICHYLESIVYWSIPWSFDISPMYVWLKLQYC